MNSTARASRRFSVGLTGGIGCGKSTIADLFAARGVAIIDTDVIAHAVTAAGGPAMPAILARFGPAALQPDGAMNRAWMRERVFADSAEKQRLEAIVHPLIRSATEEAATAATAAAERGEVAYLMFVVPLLIESANWKSRVDRVLVIDCPEQLQVERVMRRSALTEDQVRAIMAAQVSRAVRLAAADDVIVNDGAPIDLPARVDALHAEYRKIASAE